MTALQTSRRPFYCTRCGSSFDVAEKLVECLKRHEENDAAMDRMQGMLRR